MRCDYFIDTVTHRPLTLTHIMKSFVAILALVAVAAAADVPLLIRTADQAATIVEQDADVFPDQYQYRYKTSNGIAAEESGVLQNVGREDEGIAVQGGYSYTGDDGQVYSISYKADALGGYQPQGAHIPVPPPVPEYILRAVAYNLANSKPVV